MAVWLSFEHPDPSQPRDEEPIAPPGRARERAELERLGWTTSPPSEVLEQSDPDFPAGSARAVSSRPPEVTEPLRPAGEELEEDE